MIVATGRMFRSVAPYLEDAGVEEPVICYQGAAVVEPRSGTFLLHEPLELAVQRVTLGQGGMPSFKDQLEPQQIADVAQFVSSSTGG